MTKRILTAAILIVSIAGSTLASTPKSAANSKIDWQKAEKNYLVALSSENIGLRHSAASRIGEYRLEGAVNDLIKQLQFDKVENNRMVAALALMQIGDKNGIKAVEEASIYDGSEKVARFCEQLMNASASKDLSLKN